MVRSDVVPKSDKRSRWSVAICFMLLASTLLGMIAIVPSQVSADGDNELGNGVLTDTYPSVSSSHCKDTFYDGTHYWAFFAEGHQLSYAYSSDTVTWSDSSAVWTSIDYGNNLNYGDTFKVAFDGTGVNLFFGFNNQSQTANAFAYKYGTISGTTITWGSATYFPGFAVGALFSIDVILDGDGYPWVQYTYQVGPPLHMKRCVYESTTKGGTFTMVDHSLSDIDISGSYGGVGYDAALASYDDGILYIGTNQTANYVPSYFAWDGNDWSAETPLTGATSIDSNNNAGPLEVAESDDAIAVYNAYWCGDTSFNISVAFIDKATLGVTNAYNLTTESLAGSTFMGAASDSNGTFYVFYTLYQTWDPDEEVGTDPTAYYSAYNGTMSNSISTRLLFLASQPKSVSKDADHLILMYHDGGTTYMNASDTSDWTPFAGGSGPAPGTWAPTITSTAVTSVYQSEAYSYDVNANETSTYYLTTNATGLAINLNTGVLSGTVDLVGTPYVHVRVKSTAGTKSAYQNFTLTVNQVKITSSAITTLVEMAAYSYQVTATRAVDTWHLSTNASFLSISAGGKITGTGAMYANHTYRVNISADMHNSAQVIYQNYTLTMTSVAFAITSTPGTSVDEESTYSYTVTASKTITSLFLRTNASFLSLGTHTVSGLASSGSAGYYWVNLTVNDTLGAHDSDNFTLTVDELGGGGGGGGSSLVCDGSFTANGLTVTFHDESWTSMGTINSFLWVFGDGTQANTKEATHSYHQSGTYTVTHVVRDTYGREKTQYYEVEVSGPDLSGGNPASISPMTLVVFGAIIGAGSFLFIKGGMKRPLIVIGIVMLGVGLLLGGWVKLW